MAHLKCDYEDKRIDYALAGILDYWIVDPEDRIVTVLGLIEVSKNPEPPIFS